MARHDRPSNVREKYYREHNLIKTFARRSNTLFARIEASLQHNPLMTLLIIPSRNWNDFKLYTYLSILKIKAIFGLFSSLGTTNTLLFTIQLSGKLLRYEPYRRRDSGSCCLKHFSSDSTHRRSQMISLHTLHDLYLS